MDGGAAAPMTGPLVAGAPGVAITIALTVLAVALAALCAAGIVGLSDFLGVVGVIVAVFFGVWALREAVHHEQHLRTVSAELSGVADSVLTRTLGEFPSFFRYVAPLLRNAQQNVRIMGDSPCYAVVSDGKAFDEYLLSAESLHCQHRRQG